MKKQTIIILSSLLFLSACTYVQEPNITANMDLSSVDLSKEITEIESCDEHIFLILPTRQEGTTIMSALRQKKLSKIYWYDRTITLFLPFLDRQCIRVYGRK